VSREYFGNLSLLCAFSSKKDKGFLISRQGMNNLEPEFQAADACKKHIDKRN